MKNTVTWSRTRVQGLLRHRGGEYYARLYVGGKEKWIALKTQLLEVAKAKIHEEKKALAAARKIGCKILGYARAVDPNGVIVPDLVIESMRAAPPDDVRAVVAWSNSPRSTRKIRGRGGRSLPLRAPSRKIWTEAGRTTFIITLRVGFARPRTLRAK